MISLVTSGLLGPDLVTGGLVPATVTIWAIPDYLQAVEVLTTQDAWGLQNAREVQP